jgi:hypothetical protein
MEMKKLCVIALAGLLSACGAGTAVETRVQIERVPVRAPCPDPDTYKALKESRPRPLRDQPMPGSAEERVAKTAAQLGRYEAKGGWADRAEAALDRCQQGG